MDIYLVRHTEVAVGRSVAYGQSDVALSESYAEQRDHLLRHLPPAPAVIFTSPLSRCRRLADDLVKSLTTGSSIETAPGQTALAGTHRPLVRSDDRLKEFFFGDWEMIPWTDIDADALATWRSDFVTIPTPNGENFGDLSARVRAFWQDSVLPLTQTGHNRPVLIVSHGGVIRTLLCLFLDLPLQNAYRLNLDYGAVSKVTLTGSSATVQYINR